MSSGWDHALEMRKVQTTSRLTIISLLIKATIKRLMICHVGDDLQIGYHCITAVEEFVQHALEGVLRTQPRL